MRGVARELGTQPTFVKQPASQRTQVLCLGSRTCGDQLASRMLMQDFSIVAEETAWCMGVPERRPHPVKRQLAQVSSVPWRSGALPPERCMRFRVVRE